MKNKFTNVYLEILNTTLQFVKLNAANLYTVNTVNLEGIHSYLSSTLTSYTNLLSQNDSSKLHSVFKIPLFGATTKVSLSFIGNDFRSVTQSSQTRVLQ